MSTSQHGYKYKGDYCFCPGFYAVAYQGRQLFEFTPNQAYICEQLYIAAENGFSGLKQQYLLERISRNHLKSSRLRDYFKRNGKLHPAWGSFIKATPGANSKVYLDFSWTAP